MVFNPVLRALYRSYPFYRGKGFLRRQTFRRLRGITLGGDRYGSRLLLDLGNFIDATVYLEGAFESEAIDVLFAWAAKNGARYFADVGANIGLWTTRAVHLPCIERIHAFEPDPRNYAQLIANLFLTKQGSRVTTYRLAISDQPGTARFFLSRTTSSEDGQKMNTGSSGFDFEPARHAQADAIEVRVARLDDVLELSGQTVAIKIDVEGHELGVLSGARRLLERNTCAVLSEVHEPRRPAVNALMGDLGYRPTGFDASCCLMYTNGSSL